jgi:transcription factor STE12
VSLAATKLPQSHELTLSSVKYFLISAPVDWQPDQYIRRFLLPTGEYVSCVLW